MAKFLIDYRFQGRSTEVVEAPSKEDAEAMIEAKVDKDDFHIDAEEIDDVDYSVAEMHPVTRDGKEIWTTYVRSGDQRGHQSALATSPLFAFGGGA
ncbi:hypothetical protein SAMN03159496_04666 [Rhizobium sp. NFR07]|uniref:hypothetical protein n=1 Tax=Rhizobium sp. NFR07 TaxID=1566262 RepID=UPI0008EE4DB2|nr:hypothetical protein [Rhizobium sp. NFR07]SFB52576.1 hypothetical protein SAMN03159496_04666 [Rhizobium sp. NFR07]